MNTVTTKLPKHTCGVRVSDLRDGQAFRCFTPALSGQEPIKGIYVRVPDGAMIIGSEYEGLWFPCSQFDEQHCLITPVDLKIQVVKFSK